MSNDWNIFISIFQAVGVPSNFFTITPTRDTNWPISDGNKFTTVISLAEPLDYEKQNQYDVTLTAVVCCI